jgi:hypothetical protein
MTNLDSDLILKSSVARAGDSLPAWVIWIGLIKRSLAQRQI